MGIDFFLPITICCKSADCFRFRPAHDVIAATDVMIVDGDFEVAGLILKEVEVELFQPSWIQRLYFVLKHRRTAI